MSRADRSKSGNVAMIFALVFVPLVLVVGLALDLNRATSVRRNLQATLDAAVLAAAHDISDAETDADKQALLEQRFHENFTDPVPVLSVEPSIVTATAQRLEARVDARVDTLFMGLSGMKEMDVSARASVMSGAPSAAEAVLVLDTSGSMDGTPLSDLKTAAKDFVDVLELGNGNDNRVAIVPFARGVNVGTAYKSATWADIPASYSDSVTHCYSTDQQYIDAGCTQQPYTCSVGGEDGEDETEGTCYKWACPTGATVEQTCSSWTKTYTWQGCFYSRNHPYNIEDTRWDIRVNGILHGSTNSWCSRIDPVLPLSADPGVVKPAIDGLNADGDTYIVSGLAWGLRLLSPGAPFEEGSSQAELDALGGKRIMILMSDGKNTRRACDGTNHERSHHCKDDSTTNPRTLEACQAVKDAGVELYVIAFDVSDPATLSMLETCASAPPYYYSAGTGAELAASFADIGENLSTLRIAE